MLDDLEAYLDAYESGADMKLVMCETNADVKELGYAPLELKDCADACTYWGYRFQAEKDLQRSLAS